MFVLILYITSLFYISDVSIGGDLGICFRDAACTVALHEPLVNNGKYPVMGETECFNVGGRAWGVHGSNETCQAQEYLGQFSAEATSKLYV